MKKMSEKEKELEFKWRKHIFLNCVWYSGMSEEVAQVYWDLLNDDGDKK